MNRDDFRYIMEIHGIDFRIKSWDSCNLRTIYPFFVSDISSFELHDFPRKLKNVDSIFPPKLPYPKFTLHLDQHKPWHFQWSSDWSSAFICGFRAALFQKLGSWPVMILSESLFATPMMHFKQRFPKRCRVEWNDGWSMECHAYFKQRKLRFDTKFKIG